MADTGECASGGDGGQATIAAVDYQSSMILDGKQGEINNPSGLALDDDGNLYISDFVTNRGRRVNALTHIITTVAGNGRPVRIDVIM